LSFRSRRSNDWAVEKRRPVRTRLWSSRTFDTRRIRNNYSYVKRNSRFSIALHALLQIAEREGEPATSEQLAACLMTNPVVVRRTMAGLRKAALVRSTSGHGGGWVLRRAPQTIRLSDIYRALGESMLAGAGAVESPGCLVEQAVSSLMREFRREAEALLVRRLGEKTLADISASVKRAMRTHKGRKVLHAA